MGCVYIGAAEFGNGGFCSASFTIQPACRAESVGIASQEKPITSGVDSDETFPVNLAKGRMSRPRKKGVES